MINATSWALSTPPTKFSRRGAGHAPAVAGHNGVRYLLLATLTVVVLAVTLSTVPIPSEVPLVGDMARTAQAHHQERCTSRTVTEYHPMIGAYTTTQRVCTTIDHPLEPSKL